MLEPILAPPTFGRAFRLWLATIGLGTLFIALFFVLIGSPEPSIALIAGAFAGAFSLPALLLLPVNIKWAFSNCHDYPAPLAFASPSYRPLWASHARMPRISV